MNATDYKVQVLTERMQELEQRVAELEEALAQPPEPRNFCPRCGKRRGGDVNYIHTCVPPRGLEMT